MLEQELRSGLRFFDPRASSVESPHREREKREEGHVNNREVFKPEVMAETIIHPSIAQRARSSQHAMDRDVVLCSTASVSL